MTVQLPNDQGFTDAAEATDRRPIVDVRADWTRTGNPAPTGLGDLTPVIGDVTVERSLAGSLPIEAGLVEGIGTATLTATLAGRWPGYTEGPAVQLSPLRTDTELYGAPVEGAPIRAGFGLITRAGAQLVDQFRGTVRSLAIGSAGRTVTVKALDDADRLRAPVTLPVWGLARETHDAPGDRGRFRLNTQWVIDYVLRRNGIYASPPTPPGAIFAATNHGGLAPEVGYMGIIYADTDPTLNNTGSYTGPVWVPGPFGMLAPYSGREYSLTPYYACSPSPAGFPAFSFNENNGHIISAWAYVGGGGHTSAGDANGIDGRPLVSVMASEFVGTADSRFRVLYGGPGQTRISHTIVFGSNSYRFGGPLISGPPRWRYIAVHVRMNAGATATATFRVDGVNTVSTINCPVPLINYQDVPFLYTTNNLSMTNIAVCMAATPPAGEWPGEVHTPAATLDPGLGELTALPTIEGAESLATIRDVVAAEFGVFLFDEQGRARFLNRDTIAARLNGPPVRTVTATRALGDLRLERNIDSVRNTITARVEPLFATSANRGTDFYSATTVEQFQTPAKSLAEFPIDLPPAVFTIIKGPFGGYFPVTWPDARNSTFNANSRFAVSQLSDPTAGAPEINVTVRYINARRLIVRVSNPNAYPVRLCAGTEPSLIIAGQVIQPAAGETFTVSRASSAALYQSRTLELEAGPWRQHLPTLVGLARSLLAQLQQPSAVLEDIPVADDPRVQLGDVITVQDPGGLGSVTGGVVKITRTVSGTGGLRGLYTIRVRNVNPPWVLSKSRLGRNTYLKERTR